MTAGMAAKSPTAVAIRASAMPGATVIRLADRTMPILRKASMMPQTVPKRPMNGVTLPVVARKPIIFSSREISEFEALSRERLMLSILDWDRPFPGLDLGAWDGSLKPARKRLAGG